MRETWILALTLLLILEGVSATSRCFGPSTPLTAARSR
jgi:hypothetical protein